VIPHEFDLDEAIESLQENGAQFGAPQDESASEQTGTPASTD